MPSGKRSRWYTIRQRGVLLIHFKDDDPVMNGRDEPAADARHIANEDGNDSEVSVR